MQHKLLAIAGRFQNRGMNPLCVHLFSISRRYQAATTERTLTFAWGEWIIGERERRGEIKKKRQVEHNGLYIIEMHRAFLQKEQN